MDAVMDLIKQEEERQRKTLMLIPSENYTYEEVRRAVGSVLMHKYAEGYPTRRYYQGNKVVDKIEDLCKKRTLEAFGLDPQKYGANVQPHSGCEANLAVYNALLNVGDRIMSLYLPDGGHLSHGWHMGSRKTTFVSKVFEVEFYGVDPKTRVLDYDQVEKQALKFKPKMIVSGGTAYPREIDYKRMGQIAKKVGAYYLSDVAHEAGLIAGGAASSPFEWADCVTMTTHKTLRGPRGALIVCKKELLPTINSSIIPGLQGGPHLHSIAGIAVALEKTRTAEFKTYAKQTVVNAKRLAQVLIDRGLDVVTGGTDKHLVLVDLSKTGGMSQGWFVAWALEVASIIANRNTVPGEAGLPFYPSGLRLGTPAVTVRGMKEKEMELIGNWIADVVGHVGKRQMSKDKKTRDENLKKFRQEIERDEFLAMMRGEVEDLCSRFPLDF